MYNLCCPECGFSKSVPIENIPGNDSHVTCPKCKHRFQLNLSTSIQSQIDAPPSAQPSITAGGKNLTLEEAERVVRSSANWLWWIAGLSLVNTFASMFDLQYGMILGLGITQFIDAMFIVGPGETTQDISIVLRLIHIGFVLLPVGIFYYLGLRARSMSRTAYIVGILLYLVDGVVFLLVGDWVGVGFHLFVLFMLWGGYGVLSARLRAEKEGLVPASKITGNQQGKGFKMKFAVAGGLVIVISFLYLFIVMGVPVILPGPNMGEEVAASLSEVVVNKAIVIELKNNDNEKHITEISLSRPAMKKYGFSPPQGFQEESLELTKEDKKDQDAVAFVDEFNRDTVRWVGSLPLSPNASAKVVLPATNTDHLAGKIDFQWEAKLGFGGTISHFSVELDKIAVN